MGSRCLEVANPFPETSICHRPGWLHTANGPKPVYTNMRNILSMSCWPDRWWCSSCLISTAQWEETSPWSGELDVCPWKVHFSKKEALESSRGGDGGDCVTPQNEFHIPLLWDAWPTGDLQLFSQLSGVSNKALSSLSFSEIQIYKCLPAFLVAQIHSASPQDEGSMGFHGAYSQDTST